MGGLYEIKVSQKSKKHPWGDILARFLRLFESLFCVFCDFWTFFFRVDFFVILGGVERARAEGPAALTKLANSLRFSVFLVNLDFYT